MAISRVYFSEKLLEMANKTKKRKMEEKIKKKRKRKTKITEEERLITIGEIVYYSRIRDKIGSFEDKQKDW